MKKGIIITLMVAALLGILGGLLFMSRMIIVKYFGERVTGVVLEVSAPCNRYSEITVEYQHRRYVAGIAQADCREGVYKAGQEIALLYHKGYDEVMLPGLGPEFVLLIILVIAGFLYFQYRVEARKERALKEYLKGRDDVTWQ